MDLSFLFADEPLTKTIGKQEGGQFKIDPYPHVGRFTSHTQKAQSMADFARHLKTFAKDGHCLLKGKLDAKLTRESRAGHTNGNDATDWVCLDVDGANVDTIDEFLDIVGLKNLDCVVQYSASHGFTKGLRAHIFAKLSKPASPAELKIWLKHLNLETELSKDIRASSTYAALRWPLDVTTCQNDKLLYIAPPILKDKIKDPLKERILYRRGKLTEITLPQLNFAAIEEKTSKRLNALRKAAGLRSHNRPTIIFKGTEVLPYPGKSKVTSIKQARGFTYLNLNGGNSWGYYHPDDDKDIIFNFKGEPNYRTADLLPEYYLDAKAKANPIAEQPAEPGVEKPKRDKYYLAFLDRSTDQYHKGVWNETTNELHLTRTSSKDKLNDFLVDVGETPLDNVPEWDYVFDPLAPLVDPVARIANKYRGTRYTLTPKVEPAPKCPPGIHMLVKHVMAGDEEAVERFLNWLAVIWQYKCMTQTIWLLQGTFGTGKGMVVEHIISPLIGRDYVHQLPLLALARPYNGFMEEALIVFFDESRVENTIDYRRAIEQLKTLSVTGQITVEKKYANSHQARNFANFIISSNYTDSIHVPPGDRRINVGPYQLQKLEDVCNTGELLTQITKELPAFATYLASRDADKDLARRPLMNKARETAIDMSLNTIERVSKALIDGDLVHLVGESSGPSPTPSSDVSRTMIASLYHQLMERACELCIKGEKHKLTRGDLRVIYEQHCGDTPKGEAKFSRMLGHKGIDVKNIWLGTGTVKGIEVQWRKHPAIAEFMKKPEPTEKVTPIRSTKR